MKSLISIFQKLEKGFTLIELLVVIGILGILAAALVATIDPFEQLRKAQDTNIKNIAIEFVGASTRYYANRNALPWFTTANGGDNCYTSDTLPAPGVLLSNLAGSNGCIEALVNEGELKQGFLNSTYLNKIYATNPNPQTGYATDIAICFLPTSRTQQKDASTKYNQDGSTATTGTCKSQGGTANCYWCTQ